MHPALILCEMILRVLALAVRREPIPTGGWNVAAPWPFVTAISPQSCRLRLASAWRQHPDRGIVCEDCRPGQNVLSDGVRQRLQQCRGLTNPVSQGRAIEIDPVARKYLALTIEWQMVGIFVDQHMRQKA